MKRSFLLKAFTFLAFALFISTLTNAQDKPKGPLASPRDSITAKAGDALLTINYGSPSVKGRKIWGGLVPYATVWRAGANEATTFTTDKDIMVEGKPLAAGTYGFFTIPGEARWTIIFNKVAKQWGAYKYDAKQDVLRVTVTPVKAAKTAERLIYTINSDGFTLNWENLIVPVKVK